MIEIPDAAVEAAVGKFYARPAHNMAAAYHESMREALTAALPHLVLARDATTAALIDRLSLQVSEQRAEIAELEKTAADYGDIIATMTRFSEGNAKESARLRALLGRWAACPEVTEIDPEDRDPDTDQVWRETRAALEPPGDG